MMQVYERLSVGHYDLVIADESRRSIYQRYKALLDHFDALVLGLTATPTDYIDHNTFQLFACDDGLPTYLYSYEQAVADGKSCKLPGAGSPQLSRNLDWSQHICLSSLRFAEFRPAVLDLAATDQQNGRGARTLAR